MKIDLKKLIFLVLVSTFLISTNTIAVNISNTQYNELNDSLDSCPYPLDSIYPTNYEDLDPYVDLEITVTIKEIRAFDDIDKYSKPDFFVKLYINEYEFTSDIWMNQDHITIPWSKTVDVPDDKEFVEIKIELWDWDIGLNKLCDIAVNDNDNPLRRSISVEYDLKTGHWFGDDGITPPGSWWLDYSGYGRGNGCDDNTIYQRDLDCEIYFDITQTDYDGDGIPYWTEVNVYKTNPEVDDTGDDSDEDGVPIEWEFKWGTYTWRWHEYSGVYFYYLPNITEDFESMDFDLDSINNYEESLVSQWGADPYRKDIFVELDVMEKGPNGEIKSNLPQGSRELIFKAFNRQNIVFHLDYGQMGGGETVPFNPNKINSSEIDRLYYQEYFLHGDENNWRRGVFHYGLVLYTTDSAAGFAFRNNAFQISMTGHELISDKLWSERDVVYASAYMHELGHTLGLQWLGGHDRSQMFPYQLGWWLWRNYKSIMNYGYMYGYMNAPVDFSDGSHGWNDFDDWSNIDYAYFDYT